MLRSEIKNNNLLVDGQPFYICGGEVQYFRLAVSEWRDRLEKAKACGLNTISTYMPWYFHEPAEGEVDFDGRTRPERNLCRFIDLVAELDMKLVARPGPFVNSELRCGGMPEWLFRNHTATLSCKSDGKAATGRPIPAEGEPVYRDFVHKWYSQIVPIIAKYDINNGGPVILFQPDNELSAAWSYGLCNSLYDPTILKKTWPNWLKEKYGDVSSLSELYQKEYKEFANVDAPRRLPKTSSQKLCCFDWMNFKRWFFSDWGATLAKWSQELGIKVPIVFNEPVAGFYGHGDHAGFGRILNERGIKGTTACHTYSDRIMDIEGVSGIGLGVEIIKSSPWGGPPLSVEANMTWYMPRMSRSAINWEPLLRCGFGHGLMGYFIYPFSAGKTDINAIIDGPEYWDTSCVDINGKCGQMYDQTKQFYKFINAWGTEITDSEMAVDITIAYTPAQRLVDFLGAKDPLSESADNNETDVSHSETFDAEPTLDRGDQSPGHDWTDGYEGVSKQSVPPQAGIWKRTKETALLFKRLNVSYDMLELTNPNRKPGKGWLVVSSTGSLETEAIDYLLEHLDNGGGCLFFPTIPVCNELGIEDKRLTERLGIKLTEITRPAGGEIIDYGARYIDFGKKEKVGTYGWIFQHEFPPSSEVLAEYEGAPVIAKMGQDKGKVIVSGIDLSFTTNSSLLLWKNIILKAMGITPHITFEGNYYHALLRKGQNTDFLTVVNLTGDIRPATFTVSDCNFEIELRPHEARCLVMNAEVKNSRLVYTTSELTSLNEERSLFEIYGQVGTKGRVAFSKPAKVKLNNSLQKTTEIKPGINVINYEHGIKPSILEII